MSGQLLSDVESDSDVDSEDSNAEGFYTHDYPDEEDRSQSDSDVSGNGSTSRHAVVWSESD